MSGFIDLDNWKRREHFSLYNRLVSPFWNVCADVDVTRLRRLCQETPGHSFSFAAIYMALAAVNETEAFRLRIRGDKVWIHDRLDISTTVLRPDETFAFAIFPMAENFAKFQAQAHTEAQTARDGTTLGIAASGRDDLIYHSTFPWVRFTAISNPIGRNDSIPRIVFGKYSEQNARWSMPVSVEVHHALVDGLDVARFFQRFEQRLDSL